MVSVITEVNNFVEQIGDRWPNAGALVDKVSHTPYRTAEQAIDCRMHKHADFGGFSITTARTNPRIHGVRDD